MRIFGWAADRQGCGWYRVALPLHGLRTWGGHQVAVSERLPARYLDIADVVIGQRVSRPDASADWQRICRATDRPAMVYEIDDDLLDIPPTNDTRSFYALPEIRQNIIDNLSVADLVTVSTEPLAEVIRRYNPRVAVLPNVIDGALLDTPSTRRDRLTVGWAGSATHRMDMAEAAPGLRQFLHRHADVDLHLIGEDYTRVIAGTDRDVAARIRVSGWQDDIVRYYLAVDFDIGLAPLRPHLFNRSKSHIKALEYGALGIPVVASDVGPYSEFVEHGQTGYLVRRPHEWVRYLHQLAADARLRERMGAAAREHTTQWTIQARWRAWEEVLVELLERRRQAA